MRQWELTFSSSYDNYRIVVSNAVPDTSGSGTYVKVIVKRSGQSSYDTTSQIIGLMDMICTL